MRLPVYFPVMALPLHFEALANPQGISHFGRQLALRESFIRQAALQ